MMPFDFISRYNQCKHNEHVWRTDPTTGDTIIDWETGVRWRVRDGRVIERTDSRKRDVITIQEFKPGDTIKVEEAELCSGRMKKDIRETYKEKRKEGLMASEKAQAVVELIVKQSGGTAGTDKVNQLATVVDTLLEVKEKRKFPPEEFNLDNIIKVLLTAVLTGFIIKFFPDMKDSLPFGKKEEGLSGLQATGTSTETV